MNIFATVLICLLSTGRFTAESAKELEHSTYGDKNKARFSRGRVLEQTADGNTLALQLQVLVSECSEPIEHAYLDIEEGRVLRTLNTSTVALCCEACDSTEACTTWSRNRTNGTCELISATHAGFRRDSDSPFDIGGFTGGNLDIVSVDPALAYSTNPVVSYPDCRANHGRAYPNGNVLARARAPSAQHCCQACRDSWDCYSWHFNHRNRRCTLNRNIPSATNSSTFFGGTIFD